VTDDDDVLAQLLAREPLFHRLERGTTRADFEAATAPDYWEVGASGAVHDREVVWSVLAERYAHPQPEEWVVDGAACRPLGGTTHLLTYRLQFLGRTTRRATVWERTPEGWRALYHQGTVVVDG